MRTNRFTLAAAAALLATAFAVAGCTDPNGTTTPPSDETAATVNGVAIPVSKIDRLIDLKLKQGGPTAPQLTPVALAAARLQVLDQLIQEEALFQRAQKDNLIPTDDEVKQALQTEIQKANLSQEDYQKYLKEVLGQSEDEVKTDLKRQLAINKLKDKVTATIPAPTEAEMKKFFDENKAQMTAPRGLDLSVIVVDPQDNGAGDDAIGPDAAAKKAQEILTQLRGTADFATVARARSEDTSAMQGGMVGFLSEAQLQQTFPSEVALRLFSMQPGDITDPIQSQGGRLNIFKLNGKREQQQEMTYDQVKPQISQSITDQRKQVVLSALLVDAVAAANIQNNLASQIVAHPDTFGALRPSPLTQPKPDQPAQPAPAPAAPAKPAPQPEAQPGGPANANANANTAAPAKK